MDAFRAAVAGHRWGYCPCRHCRPHGAERVRSRRRGRTRLRAADREEFGEAVASIVGDRAEARAADVVTRSPALPFRCPCGSAHLTPE